MKNIPAEIVQKIKTYDRKSDNARITGVDDGNEETVMDLTIRKGFKNGWNGNIGLGYGTESKYQERAQVNSFRDNFQTTVTANVGNDNRGNGNGNNTSGQYGGRLVYSIKDKIEVGGNLTYNYRKGDTRTYNSSQNFTAQSFSNSRNLNENRSNSYGGRFKVEWKIDSITTLLFQPQFTLGDSKSNSSNVNVTFNDDPHQNGVKNPLDELDNIDNSIKINDNKSRNWSDGTNYNWSGSLMLNRHIHGNPWFGESNPTGYNGRNISLRLNGATSGSSNKAYNRRM